MESFNNEHFLKFIDESIYNFLLKNVDIMPMRLCKLIAYYYTDARIRKIYFEKLGVYLGKNTYGNLGMKVTIGEKYDKYMVYIGDNVSIGPNVAFISDSCANNAIELNQIPYVADRLTKNQKIVVENDVWIGANVTVLPGVTIGKCSVIGAGSVVTKDVEQYSVYSGVPARKVRDLNKELSEE